MSRDAQPQIASGLRPRLAGRVEKLVSAQHRRPAARVFAQNALLEKLLPPNIWWVSCATSSPSGMGAVGLKTERSDILQFAAQSGVTARSPPRRKVFRG
jgi:hypothetical protein